ncbi:putative Glucan synthesis regulatory protein [Glarea lozoyensis 74030]|uniref:Putative Glucan synthesis regulatory protein n=1 Tax=Glarea lozoyensis (strain ATCC 74030 / MF5533) TaxID=1104152 RepID=H0ECE1_GLAL7|nr:putative Glucan synthesis regulatory protein [Glarea lozoyensis 74030]
MEVRESLQIHDGQERGGMPTGIIFGCMLLDCEEMVQEWENWKKVNAEYLNQPVNYKPAIPVKALGGSSSSTSRAPSNQPGNPHWRQELLARQDSQPPNAIQKVYAHPAWIPMVRDWGGNNLAIDLAPGPAGKWGQVILFGRDYDCKYVVARSWSAFLATVADDLNSGKAWVDEETNDLKLREFRTSKVEPGYLDILRWRMDQKYGRRQSRRRSTGPNGTAGPAGSSPGGSPYASPTAEVGGEPQEGSTPSKIQTVNMPIEKLVEVETPRPSEDTKAKTLDTALESVSLEDNKENSNAGDANTTSLGLANGTAKKATVEDDTTMKTIEI